MDQTGSDRQDRQVPAGGILWLCAGAYLALHLWTLPWFPFVHSDEVWLAALSHSIGDSGPGATEPFFALTERTPHLVKIIYHYLQLPFLRLSWNAVAARLPSLLAGLGTVFCFYRLARGQAGGTDRGSRSAGAGIALLPVIAAAALALDPLFFYIAHFGRQEAMLGLLALVALLFRRAVPGTRGAALCAGVLGLGAFIHPNVFIVSLTLLPWIPQGNRRQGCTQLALYGALLAAAALAAIAGSLVLNPGFFAYYRDFGTEVGVLDPATGRIGGFLLFLRKMILRHAGTYYLPPVGAFMALSAAIVILGLLSGWLGGWPSGTRNAMYRSSLSILAGCLGILALGKFSPPSLVFLLPWTYYGLTLLLCRLAAAGRPRALAWALSLGLLVPLLNGGLLGRELLEWQPARSGRTEDSYARLVETVRLAVSGTETVLGPLNLGFAFPPGRLRAWHDMAAMPPRSAEHAALDLTDRPLFRYLQDEHVGWIIMPATEFELIYSSRPVWNSLYGNPYRFYPDLLEILGRYGTRMAVIKSRYAMRLLPYQDKAEAALEIYRLNLDE